MSISFASGTQHKLVFQWNMGFKSQIIPTPSLGQKFTSNFHSLSVFEILVQFTQTQSWEKAFFKVIPNRKVGFFKSSDNNKETESKVSSESDPKGKEEKVEDNKNSQSDVECKAIDIKAADDNSAEKDCSSDTKSHQGATGTNDTSATCVQNDSTKVNQEVAAPSVSQDLQKSETS